MIRIARRVSARPFCIVLLAMVACLASAAGAAAAPVVWTGNGDETSWGDDDNWDVGEPAPGDDVTIPGVEGANAIVGVPTIALNSLNIPDYTDDVDQVTLAGASSTITLSADSVFTGASFSGVSVTTSHQLTLASTSDGGARPTHNNAELVIAAGGSLVINAPQMAANNVVLDITGNITGSGTLKIVAPGATGVYFQRAGSVEVPVDLPLGVVSTTGPSGVTFDEPAAFAGPVTLQGTTFNGSVALSGTGSVDAGTSFEGAVNVTAGNPSFNGSTFETDSVLTVSSTMNPTFSDVTFAGAVNLTGAGVATTNATEFDNDLYIASGAALSVTGNTFLDGGTSVSGDLIATGSTTITNRGSVTQFDGSEVESDAGSIINDVSSNWTVDTDAAGSATVTPADSSVAFVNRGTLDVLTGTLDVSGKFAQTGDGMSNVHVLSTGPTPGVHFTNVHVTGMATLDGVFMHELGNSFTTPAAGTMYEVLTYGSRSGTFLETPGTFSDNAGGYVYAAAPGATSLALVTYKASTNLSATSAVPGQVITVSGSGFVPNEITHVDFGVAQGQSGTRILRVDVTASGTGAIAPTNITVPASIVPSDAGNVYSIIVEGARSTARVRTVVTINPVPTPDTDGDGLLDPADCAPNDATKPARGANVLDTDCNGVDDMLQPYDTKGSAGSDTIIGALKNDRLYGLGGNDKLFGRAGNDLLAGGAGNDKLDGGTGNDTLDSGAGNDAATGGAGNDVVAGGAGNDKVTGATGNDRLFGGAGNDALNAKDGKSGDTVSCGPGKDSVIADTKDKIAKDCERIIRR